MEISEHTFDRLDEIFAQKPINQLIDYGMKPNLGTRSQNLETTDCVSGFQVTPLPKRPFQ